MSDAVACQGGAVLRIAMLGMIEGNGHPYSWSAIVNGYDAERMAACPYPAIPEYLGRQAAGSVGIAGARVTHVWTDDPEQAGLVAAASLIPQVLERPEDAIGQVDAVIIATDDGSDHCRRAAPFVEAGLPVFVDKPLATTMAELRQFWRWQGAGARLASSSGMRYAPEMAVGGLGLEELGELRWISSVTCKSWERYGIHALEAVAPLLGAGFEGVRTLGDGSGDWVDIRHRSGIRLTVAAIPDAYGSFGAVHLYGTGGERALRLRDTYTAFRNQLLEVIAFFRGGGEPVLFAETLELMAVLIAGRRSRELGGAEVLVAEILEEVRTTEC
jgi:hypothetical protein